MKANNFVEIGHTYDLGMPLLGYQTATATPQRQILFSSACRRWIYHSDLARAYDITMIGDQVVTSWDMVEQWQNDYNRKHEDRPITTDHLAIGTMMDQLAYQLVNEYVSAMLFIAHYVNTDDEEQLAAPNDLAELI